MLTPDNNHFHELLELERCGLIQKHPHSTASSPVYVADRVLLRKDYGPELLERFGASFSALDRMEKKVLGTVFQFNTFSTARLVSAKTASFLLWHEQGGVDDIHAFDAFYRQFRSLCNRLQKKGFIKRGEGTKGYSLTGE